jgi:glycosyltransferase involved in cell wall biosynthesis
MTSREVPLLRPEPGRGLRALASAWRGRRDDLDAFGVHAARCAREISDIEPDVVLAHSCQFFRVPAIAQYLAIPSVLYLHEPNRRLYEAPFGSPWAARPAGRPLRPAAIRAFVGELARVEQARIQVRTETTSVFAFDEVLVNSAFCRESVLRAYGRLSRVCPPGIDTDRFRFQERPVPARGQVCTVGALVLEKNPVFLVHAVAAAGPAVRLFTWVANYVDAQQQQLTERAAAEAGVPFVLEVAASEDELLRRYADADVFVYAPLLEPFGLAPLEANATGLPVVAVAEGGVRETIVDGVNGTVVDHDDAAFGAAVAGLLGDIGRARSLGVAARDHVVEHWSLARSIERLEIHLSAVSQRGSQPRSANGRR